MTTSERVGTPFMHQSSLIIWKKSLKSHLTQPVMAYEKKLFAPHLSSCARSPLRKTVLTIIFNYQRTDAAAMSMSI